MNKLYVLLLIVFVSCTNKDKKIEVMQNIIDSMQVKVANVYKPGFGEFMSNIQSHHIKLWFAGKNSNWKLADFEVHEIMESLEDIGKYETDRKESKFIGMLDPAIDSVNTAIKDQDSEQFKKGYIFLTNSCNNCHRDNDFGFNIVKIPDMQPFSNQDFNAEQKK